MFGTFASKWFVDNGHQVIRNTTNQTHVLLEPGIEQRTSETMPQLLTSLYR